MFTTKPSSTAKQPKESVPPPTAPKTKQTTATDDLFAAPTDSGNVGGEPSQGSPNVATEPAKPQKKKPAGAVPMFGGVDLFGGGGGGVGIKNTVSATTAAPNVEEKQENITTTAPAETKKSFGGNKTAHVEYLLAVLSIYHIASNSGPGVYFFQCFFTLATERDRLLLVGHSHAVCKL